MTEQRSQACPACHIPQGDGQQVFPQEGSPAQSGLRHAIADAGEQPAGDIEHIGHAVLKAAQNEHHDGQIKGADLSRRAAGPHSHPHGRAHQEIAEDSPKKGRSEGQRRLCRRCGDKAFIAAVKGPGPYGHGRHQDRPGKITQIHHQPGDQKPSDGEPLFQHGNNHQIVPGEKLAAHDHHHGQACRKDQSAGHLPQQGGADGGGCPRQGDKGPGQHGQQEHPPLGSIRLGGPGGDIVFCNLF